MQKGMPIVLGLSGALLAGLAVGTADATLIHHYEFNSGGTFLEDSVGTRDLSIVDGDGTTGGPPTFVSSVTATNGTRTGVVRLAGNGATNSPNKYLLNNDGAFTLPNFTVAYWVRTDTSNQGGFKGIFASGPSGEMQFDNNNGVYRGITDAGTVNFANVVPVDQWDHIALTYDGTTTRWYYNGGEVGSNVGNPDNSFQQIRLGINRNIDNAFEGDLDDVRIYSSALDANAIAALAVIPEPSSLALLGLGGLLMARRRR